MPHVDVNGTRLFYTVRGEGAETILFSHGLLFDHSMFEAQVAHLESRYRCVAYDHRGQGESPPGDDGFDMDTLSDDTAAFIERLDIGPVHFVGLSMGGSVGLRLAARRPELLRSLILMGASAEPESNILKYRALVGLVKMVGIKPTVPKVMPIMFGQSFLKDKARKTEVEHWRKFLRARPKRITGPVEGVIDRRSVEDELAEIDCPTLILVGDEDQAIPPVHSERLHEAISGSHFSWIDRAGHSPTIEEPEQVNAQLDEFLSQLNEA